MATGSDLYYPQLRKQAFHIKRYRGGVDDALWQHREAVAHLLGPEEAYTRPSSWNLPSSSGLESIFDFLDSMPASSVLPLFSPTEIEEDAAAEGSASSLNNDDAASAAKDEAVRTGTDRPTLTLVWALHSDAQGLRRSRRTAINATEMRTPRPHPPATASPPPQKKRKRGTRCDHDHDTSPFAGDQTQRSLLPAPPSLKKKQRRSLTPQGDLVGQVLPAAVQAEVAFISALPKLANGFPSRNKLRKAPEAAVEVSRKSGYLMTVRRGGRLRRWFGDEGVFEMGMWSWLVGEHAEEGEAKGEGHME